jgi:hypothetical protein
MAGSGRRCVGQHGDELVVRPSEEDVVGARAMDAQGTLEDPHADCRLGFVKFH